MATSVVIVFFLCLSLSFGGKNLIGKNVKIVAYQACPYPYNPLKQVYLIDNKHFVQYAALQSRKKDKKKDQHNYDQDNDGVLDRDDLCPDLPGPAKTKGCPDTDGDGIADFEDDCPFLFGLIIYKGCPDTDDDGVPDNKDVCPQEKGPISNNGCPIAPSLADPVAKVLSNTENEQQIDVTTSAENVNYSPSKGNFFHTEEAIYYTENRIDSRLLNDHLFTPRKGAEARSAPLVPTPLQATTDTIKTGAAKSTSPTPYVKLINIKKNISNSDLQLIRQILAKISFEDGRGIIESETRKALNEFAELLNKHQDWQVMVHCYVNEADSDYRNLQLSTNRAHAIKSYLIQRKVTPSRIESKGYGNQLASNDTTKVVSHIDVSID